MSETIVVAIITGICAVFGQWLITRQQAAKRRIDEAVRDAKLDDRLARIEERLDSHNSYAEKLNQNIFNNVEYKSLRKSKTAEINIRVNRNKSIYKS